MLNSTFFYSQPIFFKIETSGNLTVLFQKLTLLLLFYALVDCNHCPDYPWTWRGLRIFDSPDYRQSRLTKGQIIGPFAPTPDPLGKKHPQTPSHRLPSPPYLPPFPCLWVPGARGWQTTAYPLQYRAEFDNTPLLFTLPFPVNSPSSPGVVRVVVAID